MRIAYSAGYSDALLDVKHWFENENHRPLFNKPTNSLLSLIFNRLWDHRVEFCREKECYEFTLSEEGK